MGPFNNDNSCFDPPFGPPFGKGGPRHFHKFWGDFFSDFMSRMGRGPRADRGDVRYLILDVLVEKSRHGYEIMQAIETKTRGLYRPSPGVIYPTLQMLEELGHVKSQTEGAKKIYSITEEGKKDLENHTEDIEDAYDRFDGDMHFFSEWQKEMKYLFEQVKDVIRHFRKAAKRNLWTREKMDRINEIVKKAAEEIEKVFKEE